MMGTPDRPVRTAAIASVFVAVLLVIATGTGAAQQQIEDWNDFDEVRDDLDGDYVLAKDLDKSTPGYDSVANETANGGDGFVPIARDIDPDSSGFQGTRFTGTFDGQNHTIEGLYINRTSGGYVGLFGTSDGEVRDVGVVNVDVSGVGSYVGGLIGNNDGNVTRSYATGEVSGGDLVGGLIGYNLGNVTGSNATGEVSGDSSVGGLVGGNSFGTVKDSNATGKVSGDSSVGGLVGRNGGTVTSSYATGDVSGDGSYVGGLIGRNGGTVTSSYATRDVSGDSSVGGLVGRNGGTVTSSNATGDVSGDGSYVGGLIGNTNGNVTNSYATGGVSGDGSYVGGLIGRNGGTVTSSYATGAVSGNGFLGGLVGLNSGDITDAYWDEDTTGQSDSAGGTGLTTAEMTGTAATSNMTGFDFINTWETVTNPDDYPVLSWQDRGTDPVSVVVNNVGANAWEIQSQEQEVGDTGVNNPDISLEVGTRYEFENNGWSAHPFEIRDENGDALLSQSGTGSYEGSPEVDWQDNGDTFAFTVTQDLADEMNRYVCTVHTGNMQGSMSASSVQDPVNFTVSIESTNSPVIEGENLTTTVKVTNTGGQSGTQTVTGEIPGLAPPLSESITLEPGDSTTRVTPTPTEEGDAGNYTVEVSSQNDTASTNVTVQETPSSITSPVSGVSDELWTEVTGDGQLTRGEVVGSIDAFFSGGEINGVSISRSDVVSLIEYFFSN